jgi:hypothetical protein
MNITSITNLEFPGLTCTIRQGEIKDVPAEREAAAFIVASPYIREVSDSAPTRPAPAVVPARTEVSG